MLIRLNPHFSDNSGQKPISTPVHDEVVNMQMAQGENISAYSPDTSTDVTNHACTEYEIGMTFGHLKAA